MPFQSSRSSNPVSKDAVSLHTDAWFSPSHTITFQYAFCAECSFLPWYKIPKQRLPFTTPLSQSIPVSFISDASLSDTRIRYAVCLSFFSSFLSDTSCQENTGFSFIPNGFFSACTLISSVLIPLKPLSSFVFVILSFYPFTEPTVIPFTKYFCANG